MGKAFVGKENQLKMRIKEFIELKFQLNLETLEEYEASNTTNSVFAT